MPQRLALLLTLALTGCSGPGNNDHDAGIPDLSGLDLSRGGIAASPRLFFQDYYQAYLARLEACCPGPDQATPNYQVAHDQLVAFGDLLGRFAQGAADRGRLDYDPMQGAACLMEIKGQLGNLACGDVLRGNPLELFACKGVATGRQLGHQPCAFDPECIDGLTCVGYVISNEGAAGSDGTCAFPGSAGEACGGGRTDGGSVSIDLAATYLFGSHPRCDPLLWCSSGTCQPQSAVGGPCSNDDECISGSLCHLEVCGSAGPSDAGGACKGDTDCIDGLYCDTRIMKCAYQKPAGQPCSFAFSTECTGRCSTPDGGGVGTCVGYCGTN